MGTVNGFGYLGSRFPRLKHVCQTFGIVVSTDTDAKNHEFRINFYYGTGRYARVVRGEDLYETNRKKVEQSIIDKLFEYFKLEDVKMFDFIGFCNRHNIAVNCTYDEAEYYSLTVNATYRNEEFTTKVCNGSELNQLEVARKLVRAFDITLDTLEDDKRLIDYCANGGHLGAACERYLRDDVKATLNAYYGLPKLALRIKDVKFCDPATIVFWTDGTKTVVKANDGDIFDKEKGLAMAIAKKTMGTNKSKSNYCDIFKKWCE